MNILLLEDNKSDSDLTSRHLNANIQGCRIDTAATLNQAKSLLDNNYDVALLDVKLPDGFGTDIIYLLLEKSNKTLIIMLTGSNDEEVAVTSLQAGADDYLVKKTGYLDKLVEAINYNLVQKKDRICNSTRLINIIYLEHHQSDIDLTILHFKRFAPHFRITAVSTAEKVLDLLPDNKTQTGKYHLVMADFNLPGMNALELTKIIRQEKKLEIPIVIVTGQGNEEVAIQALRLGADEYLVKRDNYLKRLPSLLTSAVQKYELIRQKGQLIENEQKYRILFAENPQPMWIYDLETLEFLEVNQAALRHYGYTRDEFLSMTIKDIRPSGDIDELMEDIKSTTNIFNFAGEWRHLKKNGECIDVEIISYAVNFNNREARHVLINDITSRKKNQRALIESEERFRSIFEEHAAVKMIIDPDNGKIVAANQSASNYYGWSVNELLQMKIYDINELPDKTIKSEIKKVLDRERMQFEFRHRHSDGTVTDVTVFSSKVIIKGKEYLHSIVYDISKRKKAENELLLKNKELLESKQKAEQSEHRLKEAQGIAKLGNWEFDLKTEEFYLSDEIYHILEIEQDTFKPTFEIFNKLIHPDDRDKAINAYKKHMTDKLPYEISYRMLLQNDKIKHVIQKCYSDFDQNGDIIKTTGTTQDITKLKETEQEILLLNQQLEQRVRERTAEISKLSEAVVNSPSIVIMTDPEGTIEYVNPKFYEITGFSINETIGQNPRFLNAAYHSKEYFMEMWETIKSGKTWKGEICNKKKSGDIIWESTSISSIKDKNNKIVYFVAVQEDITLRKQMENELRQAKEEAEIANRAKSEFLANMSHEIRTPMNAVLGFADLLYTMISDDLQRSYLSSIKSSGKNLLTLINDILDLSKIEAGKLNLQYSFINLYELLNDMKSIFLLVSKEKNIEFLIEVKKNTPAFIYIDEIRLRQVILNLLSNAFKFTAKGFVKLRAFANNYNKAIEKNNCCDLYIEVEDSGIGISNKAKSKIFESFSQQEGQSTKKYGGTGLGLTITEKLMSLMNGSIKVESDLNKGSLFQLQFKQISCSNDKSVLKEQKHIDITSIEFLGSTILIADDNSDNRKYLASTLQKYDLNVVQVSDGQEALMEIKNKKPDLIITDLRMPKLNGYQLMTILQNHDEYKEIPVVATSASVMQSSKNKIEKANFSGFLSKPFHIQELLLELIRHIPYNSNNVSHEEKIPLKKISEIKVKNIGLFYEKLESLKKLYQPLKEQQAMSDITYFANQVSAIAKEFNIDLLNDFGNTLLKATNTFDIELILQQINLFPTITELIKKHLKND